MVLFSSQALFACVHASALLVGSSFLPASLAKDMDASFLHQHEEALRAIVDNPKTSTFTAASSSAAAVSGGNLKAIDTNRSLSGDDLTIGNHDNGIGQDRFHLVSNFEGGSYPNGDSTQVHDLIMGRRVDLSKDGSTAAIAGVLFNNDDEKFRWIVKIFKKDSGTSEWDTSNPIEIIEPELTTASLFESDAYVEIALSGDGAAIFIANTKAKRFDGDTQGDGTISKYSISSSASLENSWSFPVTPDSSIAVGYYFAGLQVATTDDANTAVIGIPYAQKVELIDSTGKPAVDFSEATTDSLLGSCVAISKDGTTIAASAPGDNKIYIARYVSDASWAYEEIPGTAAGISTDGDLGSSIAINENGTIIAIGSKNHDADGGIDRGSVTAMIKTGNGWEQLGQTLTGERGEGDSSGNYYVGDQFGQSLALSDTSAYNGTGPSNTIKVVIGAPKNDPDGISGSDYYNGHVEVYEIVPQVGNTFSQIAYDIDGGTSGEKSGTSVAIDSEGKSILIGSPGFQPSSSIGGYFEGVAKMYEQTEYSSVPSTVPSSVPSISMVPSSEPSLSSVPSVLPSVSIQPSISPSLSSSPSLAPSSSSLPSSLPSAVVDREFQIISKFGPFGTDTEKDWCLTAFDNTGTAKLHVRPCRSYGSRNENLQVWKFTTSGELTLAGMASGEFCVKSIFRQIELASSCYADDASMINFSFENGSIVQTKNDKAWKLGFDPESRFERVRLYRDGTLNDVLDKWELMYSAEFPSRAPSPPPTMPLNLSNQVSNTDSLVGNADWHRMGSIDAEISADGMNAFVSSGWMQSGAYVNFYRRTDSGWEQFHQLAVLTDSAYCALSGDGKVFTLYNRNNNYGKVLTYDVDRDSGTVSQRASYLEGAYNDFLGYETRLSYDGSILALTGGKYVETYKWNSATNQWEMRGTRFPNIGNTSNSDSRTVGTLHMNEAGTIVGFNHKGYRSPQGEDVGYPDYREGAFQMYTWNESEGKWEEKGQFVSSDLQQSSFGHLHDTGGIFNEAGDIMVVAAYGYRGREWKGWPDEDVNPYWREMGFNNIRGRVWIYKFNYDSNQWDLSQILDGEGTGSHFGSETSMNSDGSILVIGNNSKGETRVYHMGEDGQYVYTSGTTLFNPGTPFRAAFGYKSQIASNANVLLVTDPDYDGEGFRLGKVWFYEW